MSTRNRSPDDVSKKFNQINATFEKCFKMVFLQLAEKHQEKGLFRKLFCLKIFFGRIHIAEIIKLQDRTKETQEKVKSIWQTQRKNQMI